MKFAFKCGIFCSVVCFLLTGCGQQKLKQTTNQSDTLLELNLEINTLIEKVNHCSMTSDCKVTANVLMDSCGPTYVFHNKEESVEQIRALSFTINQMRDPETMGPCLMIAYPTPTALSCEANKCMELIEN